MIQLPAQFSPTSSSGGPASSYARRMTAMGLLHWEAQRTTCAGRLEPVDPPVPQFRQPTGVVLLL